MKQRVTRTTRSNAWLAGLGAAIGVVLTLLLFAPARWVADACNAATEGWITLADAQGSVWKGSARLTLTAHGNRANGSNSVDLPGRIEWVLTPTWLGLDARLTASCCMDKPLLLSLQLTFPGMQLRVQEHRSTWPADILVSLGSPWNTLAIQGRLTLSLSAVSLDWIEGRTRLGGQAVLLAEDITTRLSTLTPLGHYRLILDGGDVLRLQLQTLSGSLQLAGDGQWVGGRLRFVGEVSAKPEYEQALSNLLNIVGRRSGARSIIQLG